MTGRQANTGVGVRKRHALQLFKTDMCKFFLQGRCENGERCSYAHHMEEVRGKPDLTRTSICKNIRVNGACNDRTCRFAHTETELRATHGFFKQKMCGFVQSGRCKNGGSCRFAHSKDELRPPKPPPPRNLQAEEEMMQQQQQQQQRLALHGGGEQTAAPPIELPSAHDINPRDFIFGVAAGKVPCIQAERDGMGAGAEQPPASPPVPRLSNTAASQNNSQQQRPSRSSDPSSAKNQLRSFTTHGAWAEIDSGDGESSVTEVPQSDHTSDSPSLPGGSSSTRGMTSGSQTTNETGETVSNLAQVRRTPSSCKTRRDRSELNTTEKIGKAMALVISNVPLWLTQGALLSMLEDLDDELRGNFDFFYCPWDEREGKNLGYALMNFVDSQAASGFQKRWSNRELIPTGYGHRPLRVTKAAMQGIQSYLDYFSKVKISCSSDQRFRPLYRDSNGRLQPLDMVQYTQHAQQEDGGRAGGESAVTTQPVATWGWPPQETPTDYQQQGQVMGWPVMMTPMPWPGNDHNYQVPQPAREQEPLVQPDALQLGDFSGSVGYDHEPARTPTSCQMVVVMPMDGSSCAMIPMDGSYVDPGAFLQGCGGMTNMQSMQGNWQRTEDVYAD